MPNHQVFQFTLDAKQTQSGEMASMQVTISTDGNSVSIEGISSDGDKYEGDLILKKNNRTDGDQCWVCQRNKACVWVQPCPY